VLISGTKLSQVSGSHNGTTGVTPALPIPTTLALIGVHWVAQATVTGGGVKLSSAIEGTIGTH